ncbi:cysteine hydrolase family protein [Inhella proteolytica]|uniref:Isochorismatase family protein n=1 Tax=Inhella proteolytica TaxID=2795029 RepID=A0A931NG22_9BURK|nr:isochorismatase family protein [Inhella proteolytica]MBH9579437.1 isochorismatase family protein [Inhella proteolytica]
MTRALLLIDLQRGAFDGERCDPMPDGDPLVAACLRLLEAARRRGEPVIWIQHAEEEPEAPLHPQCPGFEIDPRLDPAPHEPRIVKSAPSAFSNPLLSETLERLGVTQLVLAGLQSELCVQATAAAALQRGLPTSLIRDAHHTWPRAGHSATEVRKQVNEELEDAGVTLLSAAQYCTA